MLITANYYITIFSSHGPSWFCPIIPLPVPPLIIYHRASQYEYHPVVIIILCYPMTIVMNQSTDINDYYLIHIPKS